MQGKVEGKGGNLRCVALVLFFPRTLMHLRLTITCYSPAVSPHTHPSPPSSRTKFMIETLTNLKNNKAAKSKKGQQGQTGGNEAVERMKKFLNGMAKKRHGEWFVEDVGFSGDGNHFRR